MPAQTKSDQFCSLKKKKFLRVIDEVWDEPLNPTKQMSGVKWRQGEQETAETKRQMIMDAQPSSKAWSAGRQLDCRPNMSLSTCPFPLRIWSWLAALLAPRMGNLRFLVWFNGFCFRQGCVQRGRARVRIWRAALFCSRWSTSRCGATRRTAPEESKWVK